MSDSILLAIIGFVASVITMIVKHYLEQGNNNLKNIINSLNEIKILVQKTADGTRTITKYRLLKDMNELIERGYITLKELRDITTLYQSYKALEGNGAVTEMFERFKKLPIEKEVSDDR
jgi:hypothetical protein|nr:MAG TPA: holin protein [Caudoviricetes sp.]